MTEFTRHKPARQWAVDKPSGCPTVIFSGWISNPGGRGAFFPFLGLPHQYFETLLAKYIIGTA